MKRYILYITVAVISFGCEKSTGDDYLLKFYGDSFEDIGYSVAIAPDGYITGGQFNNLAEGGSSSNEISNKNLAVFKTGWDGNMIWKVSAGGKYSDWGRKILLLDDGSIMCAGTWTDSINAGTFETDIYVVKISSAGDVLWENRYGGSGNQTGIDIINITDGFIVLGSTDVATSASLGSAGNTSGKTDIYLLKISPAGDLLNYQYYGYPNNDLGAAVKYATDGNLIVVGTTERSETNQSAVNNNVILIKVNSNLGSPVSRILDEQGEEFASDMEVLSNGYLIAGTVGKENETQQGFSRFVKSNISDPVQDPPNLFKINNASTSVKAITKYGDGAFIFVGLTGQPSTGDMLIFKTDGSGIPDNTNVRTSGSTGLQVAYDVASGDDGYIIAVGKNQYDYNSMISMYKFKF
jgi:hypothetical protein